MTVPPIRSRKVGCEIVDGSTIGLNGTLCDGGKPIHFRCASLKDSMPVKTNGLIHEIACVDLNPVTDIDFDHGFTGWSTVDTNDTALNTIKAREDPRDIPIKDHDTTQDARDEGEEEHKLRLH